MPTDAYSWGVLIVSSSLSVNGNYARQQVYHDNQNKIWARELWGSSASNVWKPWIRIDNFGTSSLSELASALGVAQFYPNQDANLGFQGNLDDVTIASTLWFAYSGDIHPTGLPNDYNNQHGGVIVFQVGLRIKVQFLFSSQQTNGGFWYRFKWLNNKWGSWFTVTQKNS